MRALILGTLLLSGCASAPYTVRHLHVPVVRPNAFGDPSAGPWGPEGPEMWDDEGTCFWAHWDTTSCQNQT